MTEENETHEGASRMADKAQDAVGAAVGKASASVGGGTTKGFVKNAALSDMYEIRAAEIAKRRSRTPSITRLAEQMIDDHTKASADLKSILASLDGLDAPPAQLDERRQGLVDNLDAAPEDEFDKSYLEQQHAAHDEAITLFRNYAENGDKAELKTFASQTLPVLERHMQHVQDLRG